MVNGSFEIDQGKAGYGADIVARPENCDACRWAQVFTRTGAYAGGPFTDRWKGDTSPDYPTGSSTFDDRPFTPGNGAGTFSAVTVLGNIDNNSKSFQSMGAFTWGYGMDSTGKMISRPPTGTTSAQRAATIKVLRRDSPAWKIN